MNSALTLAAVCAGEALVLGAATHDTGVMVTSDSLRVLRLDKKDIKKMVHAQDMQVRVRLMNSSFKGAAWAVRYAGCCQWSGTDNDETPSSVQ